MFQKIWSALHPTPEPLYYGMRVIILSGIFQGKEGEVVDIGFSHEYLIKIDVGHNEHEFKHITRRDLRIKPQ